MSSDPVTVLAQWLKDLPPQRLIVRGVDEIRPLPHAGTGVVVGKAIYVDVIRVVAGQRVQQRFEGVRLPDATAAATAAGHDVIPQKGNLT